MSTAERILSANAAIKHKLGVVSVKDFGAKGDGVTDDTAAIQAAIDSITVGVVLLDNNYLCNSTALQIPAGKTITFRTKRPIICNTVDGNDSGLTTNKVSFQNGGTIIFDNVQATNNNAQGGVFCDYLSGNNGKVIAIGCTLNGFSTAFGSNGDDSIFIGNNITLRQITTDPTNKFTFYGFHASANNIIIIGNTVKYGRHHVYASGNCKDWVISGNVFSYSWWQSVHLYASSATYPAQGHVVSSNRLSYCGQETGNTRSSIICAGYFNNILISANNITDFVYCGIKLEGASLTDAKQTTICGNKIISGGAGTKGIVANYVSDITIKDNDLNVQDYGVVCETSSTDIRIFQNIVKCNNLLWLQIFSSTNCIVSENVVDGSVTWSGSYIQSGVFIDGTVSGLIGRNNQVDNYIVDIIYDGAPILIKKTVIATGATIPSIYHHFGDEYRYLNPAAGGYRGQVCVSSGTPGTFKGFGLLEA